MQEVWSQHLLPLPHALSSPGTSQNTNLVDGMGAVQPEVTAWGRERGEQALVPALSCGCEFWPSTWMLHAGRLCRARCARGTAAFRGLQLLNSHLETRAIYFVRENCCVCYTLFLSHTNFLICVRT